MDLISDLPDSLIVQILSLLPITDAYKTSILSKRWQYLWTSIDNVVFDCILEAHKFIYFMDTVLSHLSCATIKKFHLSFDFTGSNVMWCDSKIDKWLEFAVNKKVEDLELDFWFRGSEEYILPQVLCTSSSILKLKCKNCRISEDCVLNWTSLKSLKLEELYLEDEQIEKITLGCPQLESLNLTKFYGFHRLHLTSPKCTSLQLVDHWEPDRNRWNGWPFEIIAPYVQYLQISGCFDQVNIGFGDLSSLVHADLNFRSFNRLHRLRNAGDNTIVINNLLASVRYANELTIPSWLTEVLSLLIFEKKDTSLPLLECKRLTINSLFTKLSMLAVARLLSSTPYLENLRIISEWEFRGVRLIHNYIKYWNEDIDLSANNFISLQDNVLRGSLQNLNNIEVTSEFCGVYNHGATQLPGFLKSLLEHARSLEKLVIASEHRQCNKCSTLLPTLIASLSALPRASNSAVVSCRLS